MDIIDCTGEIEYDAYGWSDIVTEALIAELNHSARQLPGMTDERAAADVVGTALLRAMAGWDAWVPASDPRGAVRVWLHHHVVMVWFEQYERAN